MSSPLNFQSIRTGLVGSRAVLPFPKLRFPRVGWWEMQPRGCPVPTWSVPGVGGNTRLGGCEIFGVPAWRGPLPVVFWEAAVPCSAPLGCARVLPLCPPGAAASGDPGMSPPTEPGEGR